MKLLDGVYVLQSHVYIYHEFDVPEISIHKISSSSAIQARSSSCRISCII